MSVESDVQFLRQIPIFANVEPKRLKLLAFTSERLVFEPGAELLRQGELGDAAFVILEGKANVTIRSPAGPVTVAVLEKNAFVGEIAILCDVPRTASVVAVTRLQTLKVTKDRFFELVQEFPAVGVEIMRVLAGRLEATTAELARARARLREAGFET